MRATRLLELICRPPAPGGRDLLGAVVEGVAERLVEAGDCVATCHKDLHCKVSAYAIAPLLMILHRASY